MLDYTKFGLIRVKFVKDNILSSGGYDCRAIYHTMSEYPESGVMRFVVRLVIAQEAITITEYRKVKQRFQFDSVN